MKNLGRMQAIVGLSVIVAFFGACYAVWFHPLADGGARDVALILVGNLSAAFVAVVQYHYGSSAGSARKDAQRDEAAVVHTVTPPRGQP